MVLCFRVTAPHLEMAKELPNTNVPPDVFQLFNANRTYYFESDISSLPMPPATVAPPLGPSLPRLRKSRSQPQLVVTNSGKGACVVSSKPFDQSHAPSTLLHLPTALMATTPSQGTGAKQQQLDSAESMASNSVQTRYQTEPSYSSNRILKSFNHELKLFGHCVTQSARGSVSNPTSPRRSSLSDIAMVEEEEPRPRANSDSRKLSLVREETIDQVSRSQSPDAVTEHIVQESSEKSLSERSKLPGSVTMDTVDGQIVKGDKLPLTKQVVSWFTTPQTHVKDNRKEFNAFSPTSF